MSFILRIAVFLALLGFIDAEHYGNVPHDSWQEIVIGVCMGVLWQGANKAERLESQSVPEERKS